jgi:predicted metal-dependent hydrolase
MTYNYSLHDDDFGDVLITVKRRMRNISASWKLEHLCVSVPLFATRHDITSFLDKNRNAIAKLRKKPITYHLGQIIHCYNCNVNIGVQFRRKGAIYYYAEGSELHVEVADERDFDDPAICETISRCLHSLMSIRAEKNLIPLAQKVADGLNVHPASFVIGRGRFKLGHCTSSKVIQLSYNLMFLPENLIVFVICHELAHLTEMNHSAAFHALCDKYCGGHERELDKALKNFPWPVIR